MAAPMNISIPSLKAHDRIEDWQPLFVAATSALAAPAGERAAILILPSYICRDEYEREIALIAIKEELLEAAFKVLGNALDPPIDEFEATARFLKMTWASGVRVEVYATKLWKEARRASFQNRQVCVVIITQLPNKAQSTLKKWVQEREEVTDNQMREFISLKQQNLRQAEIPLDYGARGVEDKLANHCKVIAQEGPADRYSSGSEPEALEPADCKVRTFVTGSRRGRTWSDTRRAGHDLLVIRAETRARLQGLS